MFITATNRSVARNGEQRAAGRFLCLFSHNKFKWEDENNKPGDTLGQYFSVTQGDGFVLQKRCSCEHSAYSVKTCDVHGPTYNHFPADLKRKLYASVSRVALRQCGHWMMGTARIGNHFFTVSGSYGNDGLPDDVEDIPPAARAKLIAVPPEIAEQFWQGGGHNEAGREAPAMRAWALSATKPPRKKQ